MGLWVGVHRDGVEVREGRKEGRKEGRNEGVLMLTVKCLVVVLMGV